MASETGWRTTARDDLAKLIWETDPPDHRRSWDKAYRLADALLGRAGASCEKLRAAMRRALVLLEANSAGRWAAATALRDALENEVAESAVGDARVVSAEARAHLAARVREPDSGGQDDALLALRDALRSDKSGALLANERDELERLRAELARVQAGARKNAADWGSEVLTRQAAQERLARAQAETESLRARLAAAEARAGVAAARAHRAEVDRDAARATRGVAEADAAGAMWGWAALATREADRSAHLKRQRDESWRETAAAEEDERKWRDALRAAEERASALRSAVEAAPHDPDRCCTARWLKEGVCDCWKRRALAQNAPNEEES